MNVHMLTSEETGLVAELEESDEADMCPVCGRPIGPDPDAGFFLEGGPTDADFAHLITLYVASERFVDWCAQGERGGLEFVPIRGADRMSRIRVVGSAKLGPESGAKLEEECSGCGFRRYSAVERWEVDEAAWDGSGFFAVEEKQGVLLCADQMRAALEESDLRGIVFVDPALVRV